MKRVELKKVEFYKLYEEGYTFSDIAKKLNVCISEVSLFAKHYSIKSNFEYGDKEFEKIFDVLYKQGMNDCTIAKKTGKSSSAVQAYRSKLKLPVNRKNQISISDLTAEELGAMIGGLLGDSYIQPAYHKSSGGFTHSIKQQEYFIWKYNILNRLCGKISYASQIHVKTKQEYHKISTSFKSGDYLDDLLKVFYKDRIKCIPDFEFVKQHFNDYSLAVWFGDDGSKTVIATMSFPLETVEMLVEILLNRYGLHNITISKQKNILLKKSHNLLLKEVLQPILPLSMQYKFK
jgi:hypothetical protein